MPEGSVMEHPLDKLDVKKLLLNLLLKPLKSNSSQAFRHGRTHDESDARRDFCPEDPRIWVII